MNMELVKALSDKESYPGKVDKIDMKETHISWVFLTGKYAYKVKKPVNYGFLDFSTLEQRKHYCEKELQLNRRLCKDVYLSVVPITESNGAIKIGGTGKIIDYAVKMRQLPQDRIMSLLIRKGKVKKSHISKIARNIADFHKKADAIKGGHGSLGMIKGNCDENFSQTREFVGRSISKKQYNYIG